MNFFSNYLNKPTPFNPFEFLGLIIGSPSQFWFLKTLFCVHIAYLLSRKYLTDNGFLLLCIALRGGVELLTLPSEIAAFFTFSIFYALGVIFSKEALNWPAHSRFPLIWAFIFGLFWIFFAATLYSQDVPILGGRVTRQSSSRVDHRMLIYLCAFGYQTRRKFQTIDVYWKKRIGNFLSSHLVCGRFAHRLCKNFRCI